MNRVRRGTLLILALVLAITSLWGCSTAKNIDYSEVLGYLCGEETAGRLSGDVGSERAAQEIEEQLLLLGVPSQMQTYTLANYQNGSEKCSMQISIDGQIQECQKGQAYIPFYIYESIQFEGEITFNESASDPQSKAIVYDSIDQISAKSRKFGCVLIQSHVLTKTPYPQEEVLTGAFISPELYKSIATGGKSTIKLSFTSTPKELEAMNVIGKITGRDSSRAIVFSAHYDGCGADETGIYPSGVDNASGTVALLMTAEKLRDKYQASPPPVDIVFLFVSGEEQGLYGSKEFVAKAAYEDMVNINLDCIERDDTLKIEGNTQENLELLNALGEAIGAQKVKQTTGASDHAIFMGAGFTGVMITTLDQEPFETGIHTHDDGADRVDLDMLSKLAADLTDFTEENGEALFA